MSEEKKLNELEEVKTPEVSSVPETNENEGKKPCFLSGVWKAVKNAFVTLGRWIARAFTGASKSLTKRDKKNSKDEKNKDDKFNVEEIVSPGKQAVRSFFRRPLAVIALCIVVGMFLFVYLGPLFMPTYSDNYTSSMHINVKPNLTMRKVPSKLKGDIKQISGRSYFTVGLSNSGKVYVWGIGEDSVTKTKLSDIPKEVRNAKIAHVAAGSDHIIAVSEEGKVYAWGKHSLGQYVADEKDLAEQEKNDGIVVMPEVLRNSTIDASEIKKVVAGTQATAILMKDGTLYVWGNAKIYSNMSKFTTGEKFYDVAMMLGKIVGVKSDERKAIYTGDTSMKKVRLSLEAEGSVDLEKIIGSNNIEEIAATNSVVCVRLTDGKLRYNGAITTSTLVKSPTVKFNKISAGVDHFVGVGVDGKVYAWGDNTFGQCKIDGEGADVMAGAFQTYSVSAGGKLLDSAGMKGYLFGTDQFGRDVFKRIISGGKMTLTIGAVAVIISTIIGIIIGCISGYFGGWVDMILMRLTEIVAAIPFLPFAMILSALLAQTSVSESKRIFLIMVILGVLSWTGLARLVRGQVLAARENEYVTAARAMGVKDTKIAFKHILPNVISVIIVSLTLDFAGCMLTESSLSYLGFGVQEPRPTWGNMLNATTKLTVIGNFWWQWLFPGLFLAITTIAINIIGDTLRDVLDPKSSQDR